MSTCALDTRKLRDKRSKRETSSRVCPPTPTCYHTDQLAATFLVAAGSCPLDALSHARTQQRPVGTSVRSLEEEQQQTSPVVRAEGAVYTFAQHTVDECSSAVTGDTTLRGTGRPVNVSNGECHSNNPTRVFLSQFTSYNP